MQEKLKVGQLSAEHSEWRNAGHKGWVEGEVGPRLGHHWEPCLLSACDQVKKWMEILGTVCLC